MLLSFWKEYIKKDFLNNQLGYAAQHGVSQGTPCGRPGCGAPSSAVSCKRGGGRNMQYNIMGFHHAKETVEKHYW